MNIIEKDKFDNLVTDIQKFGFEKAYFANLPVSLEVAYQMTTYTREFEASLRKSAMELAKKVFDEELCEKAAPAKDAVKEVYTIERLQLEVAKVSQAIRQYKTTSILKSLSAANNKKVPLSRRVLELEKKLGLELKNQLKSHIAIDDTVDELMYLLAKR